MHIFFITQDFPPVRGGIQTYCLQLAYELSKISDGVTVICPTHKDAHDADYPFKVIRIPIFHTSYFFFKFPFYMPAILKESKDSVFLYGQWQCSLWQFIHPKKYKQFKHYSLVHGRELMNSVFRIFTPWVASKILKKLDGCLPNSQATQAILKKMVPNGFSKIVHPGVDTKKFYPIDSKLLRLELGLQDQIVIVMITRLVKRKNPALLMRAFNELAGKYQNIELLIGGSGPELPFLQTLKQQLEYKDRIQITGKIPEERLVEYFNLADIFVLPSSLLKNDIEGFGIVYLEANACKKPVVGFACGGALDAIEDEKTGLLATPNSQRSLIEKLEVLIQDPTQRLTLGRNGLAKAQNSTWERTAKEVYKFLQN